LLAERLLKEFFDTTVLKNQLVAAYIIGWPIAQNSFEAIPVCATARQTGCFCGWRTFREGYVPAYVRRETSPSFVTNPLSWTITTEYVPREENKGSVLRKFNTVFLHTTGARIGKGVLWVPRPRFPGSAFFRTKNYHIADINLFYVNLRNNIEQRITAYLNK